MKHMCGSEEENVVDIACPKCQSCSLAPGESGEGAKETVFPEERTALHKAGAKGDPMGAP